MAISKWEFVFSLSYGVWPDMPLCRHSILESTAAGGITALLLKSVRLGGAFWQLCKTSCFSVPPLFAPGRFPYQPQVAVTGCHIPGAARTCTPAGGSGSAEIYVFFGVC